MMDKTQSKRDTKPTVTMQEIAEATGMNSGTISIALSGLKANRKDGNTHIYDAKNAWTAIERYCDETIREERRRAAERIKRNGSTRDIARAKIREAEET